MGESEVIKVCNCHLLKTCPNGMVHEGDDWSSRKYTVVITVEDGRKCWVTPDGMAHYSVADARDRLARMAYTPDPVLGGEG